MKQILDTPGPDRSVDKHIKAFQPMRMPLKALRIFCGILALPIGLFVMFGSAFLIVARPSVTDIVEFYLLSLLSAGLGVMAFGPWKRWAFWKSALAAFLTSVVLMLVLPLYAWVMSIITYALQYAFAR
ncbi:MAG: hypothetical protein IPO50_00825 [Sphingomonadales bacterium]|nr:hypothetical protein [Sphingomonadales bacterium]